MFLVAFLLACGQAPEPPPAPEPAPAAEPAPAPAPEVEADAIPAGASIGGHPILPDPVVVGAISAKDVEAGIEGIRPKIDACWADHGAKKPGLGGKVLFKILIDPEGGVSKAELKSSSLRHPDTEACLAEQLKTASFAKLQSGKLAIVHYPFAFP